MSKIKVKGVKLPLVGFGTWELKGEACVRAVSTAYELGYRHFDTALLYGNQSDIRKALLGCDDVVYTSKFMPYHLDKMSIVQACEKACEELGVETIDFFLMHYPDRKRKMANIIEELSTLPKKKLAKCIGGSNFSIKHLKEIDTTQFGIDQVEFHPYLYQKELLAYCKAHDIQIVSFRSLGKGALTNDPIFDSIGKKYKKSASQICLRWLVQKEIAVIPKTASKQHMQENIDVLNFTLLDDDVAQLDHLEQKQRFCQNQWCDF